MDKFERFSDTFTLIMVGLIGIVLILAVVNYYEAYSKRIEQEAASQTEFVETQKSQQVEYKGSQPGTFFGGKEQRIILVDSGKSFNNENSFVYADTVTGQMFLVTYTKGGAVGFLLPTDVYCYDADMIGE